jgi:hypothetical protein
MINAIAVIGMGISASRKASRARKIKTLVFFVTGSTLAFSD